MYWVCLCYEVCVCGWVGGGWVGGGGGGWGGGGGGLGSHLVIDVDRTQFQHRVFETGVL